MQPEGLSAPILSRERPGIGSGIGELMRKPILRPELLKVAAMSMIDPLALEI
jgi:hypothetical protein